MAISGWVADWPLLAGIVLKRGLSALKIASDGSVRPQMGVEADISGIFNNDPTVVVDL